VRRWRPNLADGSQRVENLISKFLNLVVAALHPGHSILDLGTN
jgi:hypothetical protein